MHIPLVDLRAQYQTIKHEVMTAFDDVLEHMQPVLDFARVHRLRVIENASQAYGATHQGQRVGSLGDIGCFSLYYGKNPGASYRNGEITIPYIDWIEPLRLECEDFANTIRAGGQPRAHGGVGLEIVRILAAAQEVLEGQERQKVMAELQV